MLGGRETSTLDELALGHVRQGEYDLQIIQIPLWSSPQSNPGHRQETAVTNQDVIRKLLEPVSGVQLRADAGVRSGHSLEEYDLNLYRKSDNRLVYRIALINDHNSLNVNNRRGYSRNYLSGSSSDLTAFENSLDHLLLSH